MTRPVAYTIWPVIFWALHFIAVYALISAACGPRMLMGGDVLRAVVGLVTLAAAVVALVFVILSLRLRRGAGDDTAMVSWAQAGFWSAAISLLAILGNLWPVATMSGCTG